MWRYFSALETCRDFPLIAAFRTESPSIKRVPVMATAAAPEVFCAGPPLTFRATDTRYLGAEHRSGPNGKTTSRRPLLRRVPDQGAADLRQVFQGGAQFDLCEQTEILVRNPIQMFWRLQSLMLACLEKDIAEFRGRRPALLWRYVRIFRVAVSGVQYIGLLKRSLKVRRECFGHQHYSRMADHYGVIACAIEFPAFIHYR